MAGGQQSLRPDSLRSQGPGRSLPLNTGVTTDPPICRPDVQVPWDTLAYGQSSSSTGV